jgi:hypothetical protein
LPLLVPQVDGDGNEVSGIRLRNVAVPLATYTGWNFRNSSIGQPDELLPLTGSFPVSGYQNAPSDPGGVFNALEARRHFGPFVVAEIGMRRADMVDGFGGGQSREP